MADLGVSGESAKKGLLRWREEIWDTVAGGELYSQKSLPFWQAMAGCIAIGSIATAVDWLVSFTLHEPITCSYNCVIEKGFSEGEKRDFPILTVRVKYRKGTCWGYLQRLIFHCGRGCWDPCPSLLLGFLIGCCSHDLLLQQQWVVECGLHSPPVTNRNMKCESVFYAMMLLRCRQVFAMLKI